VPGGFPPHRAWRPGTNYKPSSGWATAVPSKCRNPAPPLSGNLPFCGCQDTCFPKAQKVLPLFTVPGHRRAPGSPLKSKKWQIAGWGEYSCNLQHIEWHQACFSSTERPSTPHCAWQLESPAPPSKSENARFPSEGRKGVTCYSASDTRISTSPRCTEAQYFTLCLPAGESHLSCPRAPPLGNKLLICMC
jgi:hypothetical protein